MKTICSLATLVRKLLFLPLENNIHIFTPPCYILHIVELLVLITPQQIPRTKPSPISIQKPDGASGQTASQMWCLVRYLPLIIGDKVPEGHEIPWGYTPSAGVHRLHFFWWNHHWGDLLKSPPFFLLKSPFFLKQLIKDHHKHFLEMFPERNLKPNKS